MSADTRAEVVKLRAEVVKLRAEVEALKTAMRVAVEVAYEQGRRGTARGSGEEDVSTLPAWSVVLDREQIAWQKFPGGDWWSSGDDEITYVDVTELESVRGPLRVLWRGQPKPSTVDPDIRPGAVANDGLWALSPKDAPPRE